MDAGPSPAGAPPEQPSAAAQRDADIAERLRRGELRAAFEQLALRYETKVFRLCCAMLHDPDLARDAAQESLLRVWRSLDRYDGRAALSTWIYAITRNRCLTALQSGLDPLQWTEEQWQAEAERRAAPAVDLADVELLRRLVEELSPAQRATLRLYYFEDRDLAEVARMLGYPEGTVKTHLFRARTALRLRLRELGLDRPDFDLP